MNTFALDFESYYDKSCSIKTLGPRGYFSHPDFDAYLMSIVGDEGTRFCGHPSEFDWNLLKDQRILSHNASFDQHLYIFGCLKGWFPSVEVAEWHCTADMVVYLGLARSLKDSSAAALGHKVDKSTRDNMSGKKWQAMPEDFQKEVIEYAIKDSELCLELWQKLSDKWPERERVISSVNRKVGFRGIPIDSAYLKESIEKTNVNLFNIEESIPWSGERSILSRIAFNDACRKEGLEPPASLALDDEDANEFLDTNSHLPWVNGVRNFRRINGLKRKLESFDSATMGDGRFYGNLMYFGGHTGRFSGSGGNLNLQNLPREEMFGVYLRNLIAPKEGRVLIAVDLSQIEVRTLCWLSKDTDTMAEIAASDDIYEAFAIRFGLWEKSKGSMKANDSSLRGKVKAMVLGCGYGCGPDKFSKVSGMELRDATKAVALYREKMRKVTALWKRLNEDIQLSINAQEEFTIDLPSNRSLRYGHIRTAMQKGKRQFVAMMNKYSKKTPVKIYGGLLSENASQALARDIFCDMLCKIDANGHEIIFHVHDEVVVECDADKAEESLRDIVSLMSTPPDWIPDIPLSAEGKILTKYEK